MDVEQILAEEVDVTFSGRRFRINPRQTIVVDVVAKPDALAIASGQIIVITNHPGQRGLPIKVTVAPRDGVVITPRKLSFGMVSVADLMKRHPEIRLSGAALRHFQISRVDVPSFMTSEKQAENLEGHLITLRLAFKTTMSSGLLEGEVVLELVRTDSSYGGGSAQDTRDRSRPKRHRNEWNKVFT